MNLHMRIEDKEIHIGHKCCGKCYFLSEETCRIYAKRAG